MKSRTFPPARNLVTSCVMGVAASLALALPATAQDAYPQSTITAPAADPAPLRARELDPSLASLSTAHVQACQQGFERLFGVPDGMDPDEALIVRGARQTYLQDTRPGDAFFSILEIAMPFERALPPGPPDGATVTGRITCSFAETAPGIFPLTPYEVKLEQEGETRLLDAGELRLFN